MDFLDPRKRHKRRKRLVVGYALIALGIAAGTVLLVYATYGYGINPRTRSIVQNGLLFVDSHPISAKITVNKVSRGSTSARLVLPAQQYTLTLNATGYRPWQRQFLLKEQAIVRLNYPLLIPLQPRLKVVKTYDRLPTLVSASPDRHWLLVGGQVSSAGKTTLEAYDITKTPPVPQRLNLPDKLLSKPGSKGGQLQAVEWSNDNKHLLVKYVYGASTEFIMLDRSQAAKSINLNKRLSVSPSSVSLRDHRSDQMYIYSAGKGTLQLATTSPILLARPFLGGLRSYKTNGADQLLYATPNKIGQLMVNIWQSGQRYRLATLPHSAQPLLAVMAYLGHQYFVVGSQTSKWLSVYKDPLIDLSKPSPGKLDALETLKIANAQSLRVSPTARFVAAQSGQKVVVYDLETNSGYHFSLQKASAAPLVWADNYHLTGTSGGRLTLVDFDGSNQIRLGPSRLASGGFINPNYHQLLSFIPAAHREAASLQSLSLTL